MSDCSANSINACTKSALVDALAESRTVSTAVTGIYQKRFRGNNAQVWRAICSSSREARTYTEQRDAGSLMGLFADRFRDSSRLTPIQDKPPQIAARASPSFSPIMLASLSMRTGLPKSCVMTAPSLKPCHSLVPRLGAVKTKSARTTPGKPIETRSNWPSRRERLINAATTASGVAGFGV